MEEKYLVCYPVYKFQLTSDQSHNMNFEKLVTVYVTVIKQSCKPSNIFDKRPHEPTQPPEVCTKWPQMVFSMSACKIWVWKKYEEILE